MSGSYNDFKPNSYLTITDKRRSLKSESDLNVLSSNSFRKLLKCQSNILNEKISDIVALVFYFKEIRGQILESPNCGNFYCDNLACLLKETFTDANRYLSTASRGPQVGISRLIDTILKAYSQKAPMETYLDLLLLFFHNFSKAKCSSKLNPGCSLKINNKFQCKCGRSQLIPSETNFFAIQINSFTEFIGESFHKILKTQLENQTYNFCSSSQCVYKSSKKIVEISHPPDLIIFKLNWNETTDVDYVYRSIKNEFNLTEFNQSFFKVYKVCVFMSETKIYYEEGGEWLSGLEKFNGFSRIIEEFSRNNVRIIAVIYKKNTEVAPSPSNTLTEGLLYSPMIRSKQALGTPIKPKNCFKCSLTSDKCRCDIKPCQMCNKNLPSYGLYCDSCRNKPENMYSTFSNAKCSTCNKNITQGTQCANCSLEKNNLPSSYSVKKPEDSSTKCMTCQLKITEGYCTYCSNLSPSVPCIKCKSIKFTCQACKSRAQSKRNSSTPAIQKKKCSFCINFLKKEEELNCSKCLVKSLTPCRTCYTQQTQPICTFCMNSKKSRAKNSIYR